VQAEAPPRTSGHKLAHELQEYAGIALYLYACFGAILLKASVLQAHGFDYAPYGLAAAKALVLAKFMLIAHKVGIGERPTSRPLLHRVLYQSAVFLAVLVALSCAEEAIVGRIHDRTLAQSIGQIADGRWLEIAATCLLLWLILLPYFGLRLIGEALGKGELRRMLFGKR
jgi:hypothetical protein